MAKDYYLILGVSNDATLEQIKSAYRRAAKRCHPDLSGAGSEPFLVIQEAYEVLGDARRRRAYDDALARENRARRRAPRSEPLRARSAPPNTWGASPSSSPWDDPFAPAWHPARATRDRAEVHVEVALTADQARRGGRVRVRLPVQVTCPACEGQGGQFFFDCLRCFGSGTVAVEQPLDIAFPRGVTDGFAGSVSLGPLSLVLHFRVDR